MSGLNFDMTAATGNVTAGVMTNATETTTSLKTAFSAVMDQAQNSGESFLSGKKQVVAPNTKVSFEIAPNTMQTKDNGSGSGKASETNGNTVGTKVEQLSQTKEPEALEVYAEELTSQLKELLGLSDEEFEDLLEKLGLTAMDLFQMENVTALILEHFEAESTVDALMNEELSNALLSSEKILMDVTTTMEEEVIESNGDEITTEFEDLLHASMEEETSSIAKEIHVEVHKESETGSDFSDEKENRNFGENSTEKFVDFFANKVDLSNIQMDGASVYDAKQIVTQLVDQIKMNISMTKTSMEMILNPEALGKVQVVVESQSGVLTARLNCENEIAKNALESSLQVLKESFEAQGLKVEKVEVTIGNYTSEYADQEGQKEEQGNKSSNKKINVDDYLEDAIDSNEQANIAPVTNINGTVEYMA